MGRDDIKMMVSPSRIIGVALTALILGVCSFVWAEIHGTSITVNNHEVRISVEEQNTKTFLNQLDRIEDKLDVVLGTN